MFCFSNVCVCVCVCKVVLAVNEPSAKEPISAMFAMLSFPKLHIKMKFKSMQSSFSRSAFTVNHLFL